MSTAPPSAAKRNLGLGLKLGLLLLAAWIVQRQVSWNDHLELADGSVVYGQIVAGLEPDAESVSLRELEGEKAVRVFGPGVWATDSKHIGLKTTLSNLNPMYWAWGMVMIFITYCFGVWRWKFLLEAQGIPTTFFKAFRLTFIGFFANNVMPGMTGGDVVKAVIIARESPGRRSEAVSTVIVDRVVGLAVLAFLGVAVILFTAVDNPAFRRAGLFVLAVLVGCMIGFVCVFSRRVRSALRINKMLKALPGSEILMKLDRAFLDYRARPKALMWAVGLSFLSHFLNVGSVIAFGWALGLPEGDVPAVVYFATVPLIFIAASVPVFPAGWGIRETLFINVFIEVGVKSVYKSQLMLLSILLGLSLLIWSLLGGIFMFWGKRHGEIPATME